MTPYIWLLLRRVDTHDNESKRLIPKASTEIGAFPPNASIARGNALHAAISELATRWETPSAVPNLI